MKKFVNTVFYVAAILFFVIFALSNAQTIELRFLTLHLQPFPVSLLILISFLAGVILGNLLNLLDRISLKREVKRLKKELQNREDHIHLPNGAQPQRHGHARPQDTHADS